MMIQYILFPGRLTSLYAADLTLRLCFLTSSTLSRTSGGVGTGAGGSVTVVVGGGERGGVEYDGRVGGSSLSSKSGGGRLS